MRKILPLFLFLLFAGTVMAGNEKTDSTSQELGRNVVKGGLFFQGFSFKNEEYGLDGIRPAGFVTGYERAFGSKTSWAVHLSAGSYKKELKGLNETITYNLSMISPQFRYYFVGTAPKGLYLGPQVNLGGLNATFGNEKAEMAGTGIGLDFGYQWVTRKSWTFEVFLGTDFLDLQEPKPNKIESALLPEYYHGTELSFRLGYNF